MDSKHAHIFTPTDSKTLFLFSPNCSQIWVIIDSGCEINMLMWFLCNFVVSVMKKFLIFQAGVCSCVQEEVVPVLGALRSLYPGRPAFDEAEGEVWVEETAGGLVLNTRCVQVNLCAVTNKTYYYQLTNIVNSFRGACLQKTWVNMYKHVTYTYTYTHLHIHSGRNTYWTCEIFFQ